MNGRKPAALQPGAPRDTLAHQLSEPAFGYDFYDPAQQHRAALEDEKENRRRSEMRYRMLLALSQCLSLHAEVLMEYAFERLSGTVHAILESRAETAGSAV